ncbi:MAG: Gfo/Idh/MocA family oxidoreductase [Acidimicrobiia bacterium]|nr:Gfo/Idh/MocA family oxidoreductase [Acidimicrobiia bacterium]
MPRVFRYGLYGVGRIGRVHGQIVKEQGHAIAAIGDEVLVAAEEARHALGEPSAPVFDDPTAMLADSPLDAVIISSHTKDHARDARPFVEAGIPVYLEKPLTSDLPEAFDFVESVGTDRTIIQIGLQRRFDEALRHAKQLLDGGLIGDIREIRSILRDQYPPPPTYTSRGLIIDMGIHVADEAIWLLGEYPDEVWARMYNAKQYDSPVDEGGNTAFVGFTTKAGTIGRLDLSRTHASGYNNETYVIGTEGTLHVGRFSGYPGPIPVELWTNEGELHEASTVFDMTTFDGDYAEFQPRFHRAYQRAHRGFRDAVDSGQPFAVTQNDVLSAQVFVEAAHLSALEEGKGRRFDHSDDVREFRRLTTVNGLLA